MSDGLATLVAAADEPRREPLTAADLTLGAPVWVRAAGQWRPGAVSQLARVRVRVNYVSDRHGNRREKWFAPPAEPVYDGRLAEPLVYRCVTARCRLQITGQPGQPEHEVRAEHETSPHHHRELN